MMRSTVHMPLLLVHKPLREEQVPSSSRDILLATAALRPSSPGMPVLEPIEPLDTSFSEFCLPPAHVVVPEDPRPGPLTRSRAPPEEPAPPEPEKSHLPMKKRILKRYQNEMKKQEEAEAERRKKLLVERIERRGLLREMLMRHHKVEFKLTHRLIVEELAKQKKKQLDDEELAFIEQSHAETLLKKAPDDVQPGEKELLEKVKLPPKMPTLVARIGSKIKETVVGRKVTRNVKDLPQLKPFDTTSFDPPSIIQKQLQKLSVEEETVAGTIVGRGGKRKKDNLLEQAKSKPTKRARDLPMLQAVEEDVVDEDSDGPEEEGEPPMLMMADEFEQMLNDDERRAMRQTNRKERIRREEVEQLRPNSVVPVPRLRFKEAWVKVELFFLEVEKRRSKLKIEQEDWYKALMRALVASNERVKTLDEGKSAGKKNKGGRPIKRFRGRNCHDNNEKRLKANEIRKEAFEIKRRQLKNLCELMDSAKLVDDLVDLQKPALDTRISLGGLELSLEQVCGVAETLGNIVCYFDHCESEKAVRTHIPRSSHKGWQFQE